MRYAVVLALFAAGCGNEIGDSCVVNSDCDPNGERICIDSQISGGYCTMQGCDYSTCPDEAACVRFFTGSFSNLDCQSNTDCSLDELCSINNKCVPRNAEIRYCMKTCDSDGDCRDGYECRTFDEMKTHGGEVVLEGGTRPTAENSPKFCALSP